jgi:phytoene dehydrogenase-like protein
MGGVGQRVANRTPINGLWLVGDSTHPGEGTAGVSYSALTVVRQIDQWLDRGAFHLKVPVQL